MPPHVVKHRFKLLPIAHAVVLLQQEWLETLLTLHCLHISPRVCLVLLNYLWLKCALGVRLYSISLINVCSRWLSGWKLWLECAVRLFNILFVTECQFLCYKAFCSLSLSVIEQTSWNLLGRKTMDTTIIPRRTTQWWFESKINVVTSL